MKKLILVLTLLCAVSFPNMSHASSLLYTFSSGDILATNSNATYGLGRIDFISGDPWPTVVLSGDKRQHALGEFKRNGTRYIYDQQVQKPNENVKYFDVYNASVGIDNPVAKNLILSTTPNPVASADLMLAPDAEGIVYAITNGTTLTRNDLLNWDSPVTATLESGYQVYSLVGLTNNANVLYVWASKRTVLSADGSYNPISSDIFVYDRATLEKKADFHFPRTGIDATKKTADDEPYAPEVGRGLVDISNTSTDKSVVLVVYDTASSDSANVIRIDEAANPVSYDVIIKSPDIKGWNIDTESPIPDEVGGFYLGCYSGDVNAEPSSTSKDCAVYHWNKTKGLTSADLPQAQTTADLVIKEGVYKGSIVVFYTTVVQVPELGVSIDRDYILHTYIWDGANNVLTPLGDGFGAELEKPFSDGRDGIYFMMETFVGSDDWDALCHWSRAEGIKTIQQSTMELEVENPPMDGNNGFYYVESRLARKPSAKGTSVDVGTFETGMRLYHCSSWNVSIDLVAHLGSFDVPASAYANLSGDNLSRVLQVSEQVQNEFGFLEDDEHELLFVGAGPIGGRMTLHAFRWNDTTRGRLSSEHIVDRFTNEDLGGYAEIATAVKFTESYSNLGSGGGCYAGFGVVAGLSVLALAISHSRRKN